jgi:hypothetical protein
LLDVDRVLEDVLEVDLDVPDEGLALWRLPLGEGKGRERGERGLFGGTGFGGVWGRGWGVVLGEGGGAGGAGAGLRGRAGLGPPLGGRPGGSLGGVVSLGLEEGSREVGLLLLVGRAGVLGLRARGTSRTGGAAGGRRGRGTAVAVLRAGPLRGGLLSHGLI